MSQHNRPLMVLASLLFAASVGTVAAERPERPDRPERDPAPCGCSADIVKKNMDLFHINRPGKALGCSETWCVDHKSFTCVGNENVGWSNDPC